MRCFINVAGRCQDGVECLASILGIVADSSRAFEGFHQIVNEQMLNSDPTEPPVGSVQGSSPWSPPCPFTGLEEFHFLECRVPAEWERLGEEEIMQIKIQVGSDTVETDDELVNDISNSGQLKKDTTDL